jgi:hypothetical protein
LSSSQLTNITKQYSQNMTMTLKNRRSLFASVFVLFHLPVFLPMVTAIGNAASPEYTASELANGTIIVYPPSNATAAGDKPYNVTGQQQQQQQTAFVYTEASLGLSSTPSSPTPAPSATASQTFDFIDDDALNGTSASTTNSSTSNSTLNDQNTFTQDGYLVKQDSNLTTTTTSNATNATENYGFSQQGYLVKQDPSLSSGNSNGGQATTGTGNTANANAFGNPVGYGNRRFLRGA